MAPAHRGQRLMPEAIRGIVARLHADGITVVDATVPVGNDSAIQALDAAEFRVQRREGDLVVYRSERRAAR
jgi:RimJ/RimL family protein N-acetyltransferase